jgi:asparagine synthase (glutamine-hydrolysing)
MRGSPRHLHAFRAVVERLVRRRQRDAVHRPKAAQDGALVSCAPNLCLIVCRPRLGLVAHHESSHEIPPGTVFFGQISCSSTEVRSTYIPAFGCQEASPSYPIGMPLTLLHLRPDEASAFVARAGAETRWLDAGAGRLGYGGASADGWSDGELSVICESDGGPSAREIAERYRREGLDLVRTVPGSLAFVVHDAARRAIHVATSLVSRIRFACWSQGEALIASTRALSILQHPGAPRAVDEDFLAHVVTGYGSPLAGTTALRDVRRLGPGFVLSVLGESIEGRAIDRWTPRSMPREDRDAWLGAFHAELAAAVARACRGRACLSLSGGLDSALVASAFVPREMGATAFSMLSGGKMPDERVAIAEIARYYASSLDWRAVDCESAVTLAELDAHPLADDPTMTPLAYLPARLRLWRQVHDSGFGVLIDGEGGDELFERLLGARDLLAEHEWPRALSYLRDHVARKSVLARAFVLPWAPARVQKSWASRAADRTPLLPSYLTESATRDPRIAAAMQRAYLQEIEGDRSARFHQWLASPFTAGAWATHRHLAAARGLTLASPLLERPIVELALGLPARWAVAREPKPFLRAAARGRVPERIRTTAKDIGYPRAMLRRLALAPEVRRALEEPRVRGRLEPWVRLERFTGMLDAIAAGHPFEDGALWRQLEGVASFAYWYARAAREHGVA